MSAEPWFNAENWEPWVYRHRYEMPETVSTAFEAQKPAKNGHHVSAAVVGSLMVETPPAAKISAQLSISDDERDPELSAPVRPIQIPGLVGELVDFCWNASPSQIAEVSIASALSMMSLLSSRKYFYGTMGLNLYILLLAKTSTGKSFAFSSNDTIQNTMVKYFEDFKPPLSQAGKELAAQLREMIMGEVGSAQGLAQQMPKSPSLLMHADEYVAAIKIMSQHVVPPHLAQMQAELLRLVETAGLNRQYRGRKYSKRTTLAEEVDVESASLTILATGTPEAFYDDMSPSILTSGFIPRFTILDYEGTVSLINKNVNPTLNQSTLNKLLYMYKQWFDQNKNFDIAQTIQTKFDDDGQARYQRFYNVCINNIKRAHENGLPVEGLWSRAKDHVVQIASLIAIGVDPVKPTMTHDIVEIAINLVRPGLDKLVRKFVNSEVGGGDNRLEAEVKKQAVKMFVEGFDYVKNKTGAKREICDAGLLQNLFLKFFCTRIACFKNHKGGENMAYENTIKSLIEYGWLERMTVDGSSVFKLNDELFKPLIVEYAKTRKRGG